MSFIEDDVMRKALREPFPPEQISKLPATQKRPALDYVGHAAVTDRLNAAAPGWTYQVEPVVVEGQDGWPHVIAVFGTLTIEGTSRQEVGAVDGPSTYGQELKEAISDFIRRGAMRFGVAIDLWSKEDLQASAAPTSPSQLTPSGGSSESPSVPTVGGPADSEEGEPATASETRLPDLSAEGPELPSDSARAKGKGTAAPSGTEGPSADAFSEKFGTHAAALRVANRKFGVKKLEDLNQRQAEALLLGGAE